MIGTDIWTLSDRIIVTQDYRGYTKAFYNNYTVIVDGTVKYTGRVYVYEPGLLTVSIYLNDILAGLSVSAVDISNMTLDILNMPYYKSEIRITFEPYETEAGEVTPAPKTIKLIPVYSQTFNDSFYYKSGIKYPVLPLNGGQEKNENLNYTLLPTIPYTFINKGYSILLANIDSANVTLTFDTDHYSWKYKIEDGNWADLCAGEEDIEIAKGQLYPLTMPSGTVLINQPSYTVGLNFTSDTIDKYLEVCNVDGCPAKYYVIWQDRFGARQCQPFNKTETKLSKYKSINKIDEFNEASPIRISVSDMIKVNSDWIDERKLPYYESIFVSNKIVLYDSEKNKFFNVCVDDKLFIYKTLRNQRKLFNLTLNLTIAETQNIIY